MTATGSIRRRVRAVLEGSGENLALDQARERLAGLPPAAVVRALLAGLSAPRALARWRAVGLLGLLVAESTNRDPEAGREVLRRLMWTLNDESGAMGWGAAEAFGEILHHSPLLAGEFANILVSHVSPCAKQLDHPDLLAGAVWGLGRLAQSQPELARACGAPEAVVQLLAHPDPGVAGAAAWALGWLGGEGAAEALRHCLEDRRGLGFLDDQSLLPTTVGHLAQKSLDRLDGSEAGEKN